MYNNMKCRSPQHTFFSPGPQAQLKTQALLVRTCLSSWIVRERALATTRLLPQASARDSAPAVHTNPEPLCRAQVSHGLLFSLTHKHLSRVVNSIHTLPVCVRL